MVQDNAYISTGFHNKVYPKKPLYIYAIVGKPYFIRQTVLKIMLTLFKGAKSTHENYLDNP